MKRLSLILIITALIQSCTDPDTTAPIIEVLSITPTDEPGLVCGEMENNVVVINSANTFTGQFKISDNEELSQYKIDLHNNFDCHGHSGKVETTDWYVLDIVDLEGSEQTENFSLDVPVDVTSGNYHFTIQATDANGNSAESVIYSLVVTNASDTENPVLTVTVPASTTLSVQKGNPINFQGTVTDNLDLGGGSNGKLELRYWSTTNQTIVDLYSEDFASSAGPTVNFNFDATVPATTADGTYIFELRSFDAVNNQSNEVQFTVEVD